MHGTTCGSIILEAVSMAYSNDPQPNPYAWFPAPLPNINFPTPYWINRLADWLMIGCLDPDIAYAALAVPAAAKMFWTLITPSTKQLVEETTGRSWICGTKQVMTGTIEGQEIAASGTGRFIYGLMKGLDIAAYHAFMVSTGAAGIFDFGSFAKKFQRICHGNQSAYRGFTPVGGWPVPWDIWQIGPEFATAGGDLIGEHLHVKRNQIWAFIAWCSFSDLYGTGGVIVSMRLRNFTTNEVYDIDTVDNRFSTQQFAIVQAFSSEGRALADFDVMLEIKCVDAAGARMVPVKGGCYARAWDPNASDAPPYWNMRTMLKQKGLT